MIGWKIKKEIKKFEWQWDRKEIECMNIIMFLRYSLILKWKELLNVG